MVSLSDRVARWDESILFSLGPFVFSSGCFIRIFVGSSLVFFLLSVSGVHTLPSPFCLDLFLSLFLLREFVPSIFSSFSFRSAFLDYCFYLFCPLPFFGVPPWGSCQFSSFVGVSPFRVSTLVLGPLSAWSLRVSFFWSLFRPFPLCYSLSHLCILSVLLISALGLSLVFSCLVRLYSFLFFSLLSTGWFLSFSLGFSQVSHSVSASGGALLLSFCRSFMPPLHLP